LIDIDCMKARSSSLSRRLTWKARLALSITASILAVSAPLLAADDVNKEQSRTAFAAGAEALESGRAKEALALFQRAYELFPHYSSLYNIGLCERALGHPIEASKALRKFITDGGPEVPAAKRKAVQKLIEESDSRIATAKIHVEPRGAVTIDGRAIEGEQTPVNPGDHVLEASADGFMPSKKAFVAPLGGEVVIDIALAPLASVPVKSADAAVAAAPARFNGLFWGFAGLAGAGLITGGITGGIALSDASAYKNPAISSAEAEDHKARGQVLRVVADVSFGVAIAAGIGAILVATRSIEPPPKAAASLFIGIAPAPLPGGLGLGLSGQF
jgi:hypothetical protein